MIGYLPHYRFHLNEQIDYHKLTHLCIAFANPDQDGNLSLEGTNIRPIVQKAHRSGVRVFLSLAGGGLKPAWKKAWKKLTQPENQQAFAEKICDFAVQHQLQGIDVDLEWHNVDDNYTGFVLALKKALDAKGLEMTAALPGTHRYPQVTDEVLAAFDWINVMAYDLTGPWQPKQVGPHAPVYFAQKSLDYWKAQGVAESKLNLGVPFYGFDFSDRRKVKSSAYGELTAYNPDLAYIDQTGKTFYNGILTIETKTKLALQHVGGLMIWELGQDAFNEYSLLNTIHETIQRHKKRKQPRTLVTKLTLKKIQPIILGQLPTVRPDGMPFAFDLELTVWDEKQVEGLLILQDVYGRTLLKKPLQCETSLTINTAFLLSNFPFGLLVQ